MVLGIANEAAQQKLPVEAERIKGNQRNLIVPLRTYGMRKFVLFTDFGFNRILICLRDAAS